MDIRRRIERYLAQSGMTPTRLGRTMMGDPRFVFDLRAGREPRQVTARRVSEWLDSRQGDAR